MPASSHPETSAAEKSGAETHCDVRSGKHSKRQIPGGSISSGSRSPIRVSRRHGGSAASSLSGHVGERQREQRGRSPYGALHMDGTARSSNTRSENSNASGQASAGASGQASAGTQQRPNGVVSHSPSHRHGEGNPSAGYRDSSSYTPTVVNSPSCAPTRLDTPSDSHFTPTRLDTPTHEQRSSTSCPATLQYLSPRRDALDTSGVQGKRALEQDPRLSPAQL